MTRLIDADALIEECNNIIEEVDAGELKEDYYDGYEAGVENIRDFAEHMPTIDAEPVKRGMWTFIRLTDKDWGHKAKECSSCGSTFFNTTLWDFCPNCGADMRGEKDG